MTDQSIKNDPLCKAIINLIEADKKLALFELQFCDDMEKCNAWKKKFLGKDSVTGKVIKWLGSGNNEDLFDRSTHN